MSYNAHDLTKRLLNALDSNYNVVDMQRVNEIISILEKLSITKELLETTRLGKHVNELRRKASDATLARRAKVLVKKWRDLVITSSQNSTPTHTSWHNKSSSIQIIHDDKTDSRTPLTSPALARVAASQAVQSPKTPLSKPVNVEAYDSDSQDVILVDDDPPLPTVHHTPLPVVIKAESPVIIIEDKKIKRDKKPKRKRTHSRAGNDSSWSERNGRNGCRQPTIDGLVLPAAGAKKVKTTKELLEDIQSRLRDPSSVSRTSSPDCEVIEPVQSPLSKKIKFEETPNDAELTSRDEDTRILDAREPSPERPLCRCTEDETESECPAAFNYTPTPSHVVALHNTLLPGLNGNKGKVIVPDLFLRPVTNAETEGLFASVVPLYHYLDYSKDRTVKNLSSVNLIKHNNIYEQFIMETPSPQVEGGNGPSGWPEENHSEAIYPEKPLEEPLDSRVDKVESTPLTYSLAAKAPISSLPESAVELKNCLEDAALNTERDQLGRPIESSDFAEWHEPVRLPSGIDALPYVIID